MFVFLLGIEFWDSSIYPRHKSFTSYVCKHLPVCGFSFHSVNNVFRRAAILHYITSNINLLSISFDIVFKKCYYLKFTKMFSYVFSMSFMVSVLNLSLWFKLISSFSYYMSHPFLRQMLNVTLFSVQPWLKISFCLENKSTKYFLSKAEVCFNSTCYYILDLLFTIKWPIFPILLPRLLHDITILLPKLLLWIPELFAAELLFWFLCPRLVLLVSDSSVLFRHYNKQFKKAEWTASFLHPSILI